MADQSAAVTREDALAFADEAFRNRDITFSHRDVVDMTGALGTFLSRRCLASVSSASADYVLVPREPTEAMLHAYQDCPYEGGEDKWSAMLAASPEPVPATNQAGEVDIKGMVSRFLAWKLPSDFHPDAGITFKAAFNEHTEHPMTHEPTGTNLFTATQAEAMIRYLIGDSRPATDRAGAGWIAGNNIGQWRTFDSFGWAWTDRRDLAVRYARRVDAELVHGEDEDSWRVEQYCPALATQPATSQEGEAMRLRDAVQRLIRLAPHDSDYVPVHQGVIEDLRKAVCDFDEAHPVGVKCSFCESPSATLVTDTSDILPSCARCAEAWAADPGFTLSATPTPPTLSEDLRKPHVFLDCDGVLADFDTYAEAYFGMNPRAYEKQMGSAKFWEQLEAKGDFYRKLPLMPDAMVLFEGVKHLHPTILTGCPRGDWAQGQKVAWAAEHFPGVPIITCRSADKRDYAKPGDVIIDDWPQHRHRWIEMGGVFIVHHDAASSLAALFAHYPALALAQEQAS